MTAMDDWWWVRVPTKVCMTDRGEERSPTGPGKQPKRDNEARLSSKQISKCSAGPPPHVQPTTTSSPPRQCFDLAEKAKVEDKYFYILYEGIHSYMNE